MMPFAIAMLTCTTSCHINLHIAVDTQARNANKSVHIYIIFTKAFHQVFRDYRVMKMSIKK